MTYREMSIVSKDATTVPSSVSSHDKKTSNKQTKNWRYSHKFPK